jgi:uncharacterized membrane protein
MPKKQKSSKSNARETKKAIVLNSGRKSPVPMIIITVAALAVAVGLGLLFAPGGDSPISPENGVPQAATSDANGRIAYAVNMFDDGKARFFQYADAEGNTTIKYFILKSTDGVIRAAFDACDVCWPEGKGYEQDGTVMVCLNCGRRFASVKVNEVQGGCNPAPLQRTIQGDQVVIHVDDIKQGRAYFNFTNKV